MSFEYSLGLPLPLRGIAITVQVIYGSFGRSDEFGEYSVIARSGAYDTRSGYFFPGDPKKFEKSGLRAKLSKNDTAVINTYIIYKGNSPTKTQLPGRVKPNPFGLKNMAGNVSEFCSSPQLYKN